MTLNSQFDNLSKSFIFTEIALRNKAYHEAHPNARVLRLGIGDVSEPICQAAIEAMHKAVDELAQRETMHGYGPEIGYPFLRNAICADYAQRGIKLDKTEVFISDGAGSDIGNLGDILSQQNTVAITNPYYPAYLDSNLIDGRINIEFLPCTAANGFIPGLPKRKADIIYLCYPNNPTGICLTRAELQRFVDYALDNQSLIIFDGAYEAFITNPNIPHSIYELDGAKQCCIELRSFSKSAGFTGLRCGYTVVPKDIANGKANALWNRRQCTKFNGASYIAQRAAEATLTPEGKAQTAIAIRQYQQNARILRNGLQDMGFIVYGGENAPYVWLKGKKGLSSWQMFDALLEQCQILTTPGIGFGSCGEGYIRLSGFAATDICKEAIERLKLLYI